MPHRYLLGIEGGATRTTGVLVDRKLEVIARHEVGPSNVHAVGLETAVRSLSDLIGELLLGAGVGWSGVVASSFCLAGLRSSADEALWRWLVEQMGVRSFVVLTHDAAATLAAGSEDTTGLLVLCGTGSLVYGRHPDGRERSAIGRGPILGDEGSGFDIGHRALRAIARADDGRGPHTLLEQLIPKALGQESIDALIAHLSPFAKDRVAAVAPCVFEAADRADGVAWQIVEAALDELVSGVEAVVKDLWSPATEPLKTVVLGGGVLRHQAGFAKVLGDRIAKLVPTANCVVPTVEGAVGAARIAQRWLNARGMGEQP